MDDDILQEAKVRLCDRYTAAELVEFLRLDTEDIIAEFFDLVYQRCPELFEEVGILSEEDDE